jgi:peptidoglycan/xylan/chitin deacetylase (PgdA/CDA1 family)
VKYRKFSDLLVQPPQIVKRLLDNYFWTIDSDYKEIYLTFDDGPIPELTQSVLNLLHVFDAEATFFCVGDNVRKHPDVYEQILKRGHAVGNHTFSHLNGFKTETNEYLDNVAKAAELIDSKLFRPPYGKLKQPQLNALLPDYKIILWDVLSYDFDISISPDECFGNVTQFTRNGSIVVFHDNQKARDNMLHALSLTLTYFSEKGFKFRKIEADKLLLKLH